MSIVTDLKPTDACPACGGELKKVRTLTDAEFAKVFDRENPIAVPPNMDTANPQQRAELGALYRCPSCRYSARFKDVAPAAAAKPAPAAAPAHTGTPSDGTA